MTLRDVRKHDGRGRKGQALLEVLIASTIMMLVCLVVIGGVIFARRSIAAAENRLAALHLARETLEVLRTKKYYDSVLSSQSYQLKLPAPYSGRYTVTANNSDRTKTVTVIIQWRESWGMSQNLQLTTLFCESLHI